MLLSLASICSLIAEVLEKQAARFSGVMELPPPHSGRVLFTFREFGSTRSGNCG